MSETFMNKKKKPRFVRQESTKLKRLKDKWRRPRGIDSKKHEEKRGKGKIPKIGYKKPNYLRGIHPSGYYPVLIHNVVELSTINPKKEAAIIASSIGRKKRNEIIRIANEKKITILNPRKGEK
ncbi:MAG TPA: 50S ribosomal protein L32e [Candidatus Altiarchaeales archaeon]|nr:50S ribosomal protein L32e [Candidatus Altiarchaeales archaeon]